MIYFLFKGEISPEEQIKEMQLQKLQKYIIKNKKTEFNSNVYSQKHLNDKYIFFIRKLHNRTNNIPILKYIITNEIINKIKENQMEDAFQLICKKVKYLSITIFLCFYALNGCHNDYFAETGSTYNAENIYIPFVIHLIENTESSHLKKFKSIFNFSGPKKKEDTSQNYYAAQPLDGLDEYFFDEIEYFHKKRSRIKKADLVENRKKIIHSNDYFFDETDYFYKKGPFSITRAGLVEHRKKIIHNIIYDIKNYVIPYTNLLELYEHYQKNGNLNDYKKPKQEKRLQQITEQEKKRSNNDLALTTIKTKKTTQQNSLPTTRNPKNFLITKKTIWIIISISIGTLTIIFIKLKKKNNSNHFYKKK